MDLIKMQNEVRDWTVEKGWRGPEAPPRTLLEDMALLSSETSEMLEAYREDGMSRWFMFFPPTGYGHTPFRFYLDDDSFDYNTGMGIRSEITTSQPGHPVIQSFVQSEKEGKPEGVAAELADVLIRLLDNYAQHEVTPLDDVVHDHMDYVRLTDLDKIKTLGDWVAFIEMEIATLTCLFLKGPLDQSWISAALDKILAAILLAADALDIDLEAEFRAKMDYNTTRSHRHGGKLL